MLDLQRGKRSPIECSGYCSASVRLPLDADEDCALEALMGLAREWGRAVLLPVDDASAMFVDDNADALAGAFLVPRGPRGLARRLADKREMHALCLEHGVATPLAAFPEREQDLDRDATSIGLPVVLKRIDASRPSTLPTPNVRVAHDRRELLTAFHAMRSPEGGNVMLQEHIPTSPRGDWMFNGYFDSQSCCRAAFTGLKLRQAPPEAGATSLGVCQANDALERQTVGLMAAIGYRGPLDVDYRLDPRDGRYKLLDVNPRIGASFRLFVGADGTDVLRAMYLDLTGQRLPTIEQRNGRRWLVEPQDLRSSLSHRRGGELTVGGWLRSLSGIEETAWWSRDDPWPFFAMLAQLLVGRLRRFGRGLWGASSARKAPR